MAQELNIHEEILVLNRTDAEFLGALLNKYMREQYTSPHLEQLRNKLWHMESRLLCGQNR